METTRSHSDVQSAANESTNHEMRHEMPPPASSTIRDESRLLARRRSQADWEDRWHNGGGW